MRKNKCDKCKKVYQRTNWLHDLCETCEGEGSILKIKNLLDRIEWGSAELSIREWARAAIRELEKLR